MSDFSIRVFSASGAGGFQAEAMAVDAGLAVVSG